MSQHYIVEQMGHRRFGALVTETEIAGVKMLRCEVLGPVAPAVSMVTVIHPNTVFALTECDETAARRANRYGTPVTLVLSDACDEDDEQSDDSDDNSDEDVLEEPECGSEVAEESDWS